jgi:hypothetical protein
LPRPEDDVSARIQLPSAERDWLILCASFNVCPAAPVFPTRSLPARSTR